jgi:hypothetical protein
LMCLVEWVMARGAAYSYQQRDCRDGSVCDA